VPKGNREVDLGLLWLFACLQGGIELGAATAEWDVDRTHALPAPVVLEITPVEALWIGETVSVEVEQAEPGVDVLLYGAFGEPGPGPCRHGDCLDLTSPVYLLGRAAADHQGEADILVSVPSGLVDGDIVSLQAWQAPDSGNVVSAPWTTHVLVAVDGCTSRSAPNYSEAANRDDGSCAETCEEARTAQDTALDDARSCSSNADCDIDLPTSCCTVPGNSAWADLDMLERLADHMVLECGEACVGCPAGGAPVCLDGRCEVGSGGSAPGASGSGVAAPGSGTGTASGSGCGFE